MPSRVTRSGRAVRNSSTSQAKLDALELLERKRRGEKIEVGIKEDEPLFDEVAEEEYRRSHKGGFIVDAGTDEEEDLDDEFIDDEDYEDGHRGRSRGKRKRKDKSAEVDPRQRSMKSFLGGSSGGFKQSSTSSFSKPSTSSQPEVNEDDILSQMLFQVPENKSSPAQKPLRVAARLTSTKVATPPTRPAQNLDPIGVKRPRMATPPPEENYSSGPAADDCFDDSMPFDSLPAELEQSIKREEKFAYAEAPAEDNSGIEVTALNDDMRSNLDFRELDDGRQTTRFYWYDCCEDQAKFPGVVYFFGRIFTTTAKRYVSCCAIVKNIQRTIYLMINNGCSYDEALGEFTNVTSKVYKIKNFACERVTKKYAFSEDPDVPLEGEYLKVEYPYTQPSLPGDLRGQTFSKVLNMNQSPMEKLILELKLRGPCWLNLIDPTTPNTQLTWTRIELVLDDPRNLDVELDVSDLRQPYFCTFSLSLCTYPNPVTHLNEIVAIAGMVNTTFNLEQCLKRNNKASGHFCIMTKPAANHRELKLPYDFTSAVKKYRKTRFELFDTERDLLLDFLEKFNQLDPDIVVGHDLLNFDYETLVMRMSKNKIGLWSRLGRFKRSELPSTKAAFRYMFSGRVVCDIRTSAMEHIRARSYDLTELTSQVLQKNRRDFDHSAIVESFKSSQGLIKLLDSTWEDNDSIFSILVELNIIPLALKITNITGNILSRTLAAGRSERNEYLLLHAFHEDNFICPEKQINRFQKRGFNKDRLADGGDEDNVKDAGPVRKKAAYMGGLVLEPKTGYYDSCILLMDFNSLYPSIIQEFNICFSTVKRPDKCETGAGEFIASVPDESIETGILPAQLKNLVDRRRKVKRLLEESKSPEEKMMLDIEQKALKLTANSMYGCLGFEQSRFYAKHLASLVTFKGREILMNTKALVEKLGYEVIYGDTDSLMIDTKVIDYDEVILKGSAIKSEINRTFKLLEIDIDGVYRPLLLLKKKNYAGTAIKKLPDGSLLKTMETKGLDTVRRDRAIIAKEAGEKILSMILFDEKDIDQTVEDIHNYLKLLGEQVQTSQVPKEKFLISKQLNRNPEEYRDTKGLGHVALALRHNADSKKTRKLKAGDTVEYVICSDNTSESANQRAYTLEEMTRDELKLDYEYYLCQQIHPVITRICDRLPITNAYVLAEMLGVEKCSSLHIRREETETTKRDQLISKGEARFHSCKPLVIHCFNCNAPNEISTRTMKNSNKKLEMSLTHCPSCSIRYGMKGDSIVVQVIALIRQLTLELYNSSFICESSDCGNTTRNAFRPLTTDEGSNLTATKAQPICDICESPMVAEFDDRKMDLQLGYLKHLFDMERELQDTADLEKPTEDTQQMYKNCLKEHGLLGY